MDAGSIDSGVLPVPPLLSELATRPEPRFHRILEACARSPEVAERFRTLMAGAIDRVVTATRVGVGDGTVRDDVDPRHLATILVGLALGATTAIDTGMPLDVEGTADAILALLAPAGRG